MIIQRTANKPKDHLTGKAPYRFESTFLQQRVCKPSVPQCSVPRERANQKVKMGLSPTTATMIHRTHPRPVDTHMPAYQGADSLMVRHTGGMVAPAFCGQTCEPGSDICSEHLPRAAAATFCGNRGRATGPVEQPDKFELVIADHVRSRRAGRGSAGPAGAQRPADRLLQVACGSSILLPTLPWSASEDGVS